MKAKTKQVQGCWHRAQLVCVPSMQEALPDDWMRDEREAVDGLVFPAEAAQVDDGTVCSKKKKKKRRDGE